MSDWGTLPPVIIDETSALPKYRQLSAAVTSFILNGILAPETKLPSENELFDLLKLSRSTIRKAWDELELQGLIYRKQGQGSFVAPAQVKPSPNLPIGPDKPGKTAIHGQHLAGGIIGLLVPNMSNEIYPAIVRGVEEVAASQGCTVFIGNTYSDRERELVLMKQMIALKVRGLIIEPAQAREDTPESANFQLLSAFPCPCVLIANDIPGLGLSRVILDDQTGGRLATEHLISRGHRRIAYIYKETVLAAVDRREGYRSALAKAGIPLDGNLLLSYSEAQEHEHPGYTLTKKLLETDQPPSAIFYYNDDLAFDGIQAIRESGRSIPFDVSVIASDNTQSAASSEYQLCSIEHPKYLVGRWAADILFDQIRSGSAWIKRCLTIRPELVERNSVGRHHE